MGSLTASQYLSALLREQTQNFSPKMALDIGAGCAGGKLDLNLFDEEILIFLGTFPGMAGILVGYPLDTVKVRIQTQDPTNLKYRGTFQCLSSIIKDEGVSVSNFFV